VQSFRTTNLSITPEISIQLKNITDNRYELVVTDNGIGIPSNSLSNPTNSIGLQLIHIFVQQLKGKMEFLEAKKGMAVKILFSDI